MSQALLSCTRAGANHRQASTLHARIISRSVCATPARRAVAATKAAPDEPRKAQKKVSLQSRRSYCSISTSLNFAAPNHKVNKVKVAPSAQAKAQSKAAAESKMVNLLTMAYDAPMVKPPEPSPEEKERRYQIGRNWVIGQWKEHNEINHDLAVKIRMKRYAMKMLPKEGELGDSLVSVDGKETSVYGRWKSEAHKINDMHGPPDHRHIPMWTPPIEGFDISQYIESEE